jgi:ZIP family zinc transporter
MLAAGAGLSTTVGAAFVFIKRFFHPKSFGLAISLGFSSGVMIGVSYLDIFGKAVNHFENCRCMLIHNDPTKSAYILAILFTITGILSLFLLDGFIYLFKKGVPFKSNNKNAESNMLPHFHHSNPALANFDGKNHTKSASENSNKSPSDEDGFSAIPLQSVNNSDRKGSSRSESCEWNCFNFGIFTNACKKIDSKDKEISEEKDSLNIKGKKSKLKRLGLITALVITLHNIPEGLVTFVAALKDLKVGGSLVFAIIAHNIPEGFCIAIPIYYATGSRWKGFLYGFWSGVSEIFGALIGFALTNTYTGDGLYAALFGLVVGLMTSIVIKEMLPTAFEYDPHNKVVSYSFLGGFIIMIISLILFTL